MADMTDPHPAHIEIEFDRPAMVQYLRVRWLISWLYLTPLGALMGFSTVAQALDDGLPSGVNPLLLILERTGAGAGIAALAGLVIYLLFGHFRAPRHAANLRVSVEGAFLRIQQDLWVRTDRKLHFRSIVDYATVQGGLMRRFGLHALRMTTTASGQYSVLTLYGIKDCLKVRDMLADIDRIREME